MGPFHWKEVLLWYVLFESLLVSCTISSIPPRIVPKMYLDVQFLRKMIEKYKPRLRTVHGIDPMIWWTEFIERIEQEQAAMCPDCLQCLKKLAAVKILRKDPEKASKQKKKRGALKIGNTLGRVQVSGNSNIPSPYSPQGAHATPRTRLSYYIFD